MKNLICFSLGIALIMFFSNSSNAQDTLRLKSRATIACKVFKISETEVEYKKWDNLEGPVYAIDKNKVLEIRFVNGIVEKFLPDEMDVAQEQSILDKRNSIKFDLFSPVFDKLTFGFEHCIKVGWNVEAYASFISSNILPGSIGKNFVNDSRTQGIAIRLGNKFFLGSDYYVKGTRYAHPLKGRFIRIDVSFSQFAINNVYEYSGYNYWGYSLNKGSLNVSQFGMGITYGRQFILGNMFTLQYNLGLNYSGTSAQFKISEANVQFPPNGHYFHYYPSERNYTDFGTFSNILRLGDLPIGVSGNITLGYILGGSKKHTIKPPVSK
jgi:hypothetical protein